MTTPTGSIRAGQPLAFSVVSLSTTSHPHTTPLPPPSSREDSAHLQATWPYRAQIYCPTIPSPRLNATQIPSLNSPLLSSVPLPAAHLGELLLPFLPGAPRSLSPTSVFIQSAPNRLMGQWCLSVQNPHNLLLTFMGLLALSLLRGNHPRSAPQRWKQRASPSP